MISYPMSVGGITTRVLEAGSANKEILVFVHGTGGRADRWSRNVDAMAAQGFHVYAFDLPGHGFASKGKGVACSVPAYRKVLASFMDAISADKAVIVGTSLGGHVVASYACEHPERIKAIALCGSMGLIPIGDEARGRIQAGANNQTQAGIAGKMQRVIFDQGMVTPDMLEEEWRINNSEGSKESFEALGNYIMADLDKEVVGDQLAQQKFPVLLVWGAEDKTVAPSVGETVRQKLPQSRLAILDGAAHTVYYEKADHFNRVLTDFIAGKAGEYKAPGVTWK